MIRFAHPEYFYLFILIPALAVFYGLAFAYKRRLLQRLGDPELVAKLTAQVSRRRQATKALLTLLAMALLILGLADPQIGTRLETVKRKGVDIFVALDVSRSMLAEDVPPNRLEKARHEIDNFIDLLQGDRIGLIVFSGLAFVQCPLTLDYSAAKLFLDEVEVGMVPQPGTNLSEAIKTAMRSFVSKELKHKVLILITDGESHEGDPVEVAKQASREGVVIYTIGIGSPQGAPIPEFDRYGNKVGYKKDREGRIVTTKLDVLTLEKIAFETGGKFYISSGGETELDKIYQEISRMEKKELASRQFTQFEDRFQVFLFLAFFVLFWEGLMSERRRIRRLRSRLMVEKQT
ncbi:MAG: VWA domain-containing protein [Calditrichaeota bacterium]|nr:MAG: VWA domain-containing protein [Calditrichota bacterium]